MTAPRYLSWENFKSTVLIAGEQRVHRVTDAPLVEVFGDGITNKIGLLVETASGSEIPAELSRLASVTLRELNHNGRNCIEVATSTASLFRQFYHFSVAVAERIIVEKRPPLEAVTLELRCFTDLLETKPLLALERQIGLIGELLFLERLIQKIGTRAVDGWIGWMSEPHDFRLAKLEFEVKTTISAQRIHTINGIEQLVPSKDCTLCLVSTVLGPPGAGGGFSLTRKVEELTGLLAGDLARLEQFNAALKGCEFRSEDSVHYSRLFAIRRPSAIIHVDAAFPAITRPGIQAVLGPPASRIEGVRYDVNVEGLEHEDGTPAFKSALPS